MARWAATYASATNASAMVALDAKDAVFWDGIPPTVRRLRQLRSLFHSPVHQLSGRSKVVFCDPLIRIYGGGNFATSTATYEFNVKTPSGQAVSQILRFSFAFLKGGD